MVFNGLSVEKGKIHCGHVVGRVEDSSAPLYTPRYSEKKGTRPGVSKTCLLALLRRHKVRMPPKRLQQLQSPAHLVDKTRLFCRATSSLGQAPTHAFLYREKQHLSYECTLSFIHHSKIVILTT